MSNVFSPQGPNAVLAPPLGIDVNRYGTDVQTFVRDASAPGKADGTVLDSAFFNRIIMNLHHIIDESRIDAVPGDSTALFRAIKKIAAPPEPRKYRPGLQLMDNFLGLTLGLNMLASMAAVDPQADKMFVFDASAKEVKETSAYDVVRSTIRSGGIIDVYEDDTTGTVTFTVDGSNFVTLDRRVTGVKGIGGGGELINNPEFYLDLGTLPEHSGGIDLYRDRLAMHDWSKGETKSVTVGEVVGAAISGVEFLIGAGAGNLNLGEFGGGVIPNNASIRQALQAVATFTEDGFASIGTEVDAKVDAALTQAMVDVNNVITDINDTIAGINGTIESINNSIASNLADVNDAISGIHDTVAELDAQGALLVADVNEMLADITGLQDSSVEHETQIDALTASVAGKASASALSALDARVTETEDSVEAQAALINSLNTTVAGKASAAALNALTTRVTDVEGVNSSQATALTNLNTALAGKASASALDSLTSRVTEAEGDIDAQTTALTNLTTTVAGKASAAALSALDTRVTTAEGVNTSQGNAITSLSNEVAGKASAAALSALETRVTSAEGVNTSQATAITNLNTGLAGKASTSAVESLTTRMTEAEGDIDAQQTALTNLTTTVAGKASASALNSLETRVTAAEGVNTSQGTAITNLNNGLAGKADASALNALTTRVTNAEGVNTSQATALTNLATDVAGKASASALSALETRVTSAEGVNTSQGTSITNLNNGLAGKADASALSALTTRVTNAEGVNSSQATAITNLQTDVAGKASASALNALTTRVTDAEGVNSSQATAITNLNTGLAGKASASALSTLTTQVNEIDGNIDSLAAALTSISAGSTAGDVATAMVKMSAVSQPAGWTSRIAMQVRGGTGDTYKSAGWYMDVISGGASRVVIEADKFVVQNGSGATVPFSVSGGVVYLGEVMVPAARLTVGSATNLIANSDFLAGNAGWGQEWSPEPSSFTVGGRYDVYAALGSALEIRQINGNQTAAGNNIEYGITPYNPRTGGAMNYEVVGNDWYEFSVYCYGHRAKGCQPYIQWLTDAMVHISYSSLGVLQANQGGNPAQALSAYATAWDKYQAPATAKYARIFFRHKGTVSGQGDSYVWIKRPYFGKASGPNQTVRSPWSEGAVTLIQGGNIATNAISANHISVANLAAISAVLGNVDISSAYIGSLQVGTINIGVGVITDEKTNKTPPNAPGIPSLTLETGDFDLDGSPDVSLTASWTAPSFAGAIPPARTYELEVWMARALNGTYAAVRKYVVATGTSYTFPARANRFYKCRVTAVNYAGIPGAPSGLTATGRQPSPPDITIPNVSGVFGEQSFNGVVINWDRVTLPEYDFTEVQVRTGAGNYTDFDRVRGSRMYDGRLYNNQNYRLRHVDKAGNATGWFTYNQNFSALKIDGNYDIAPGSLVANNYADLSIAGAKIKNNTITADKIALNAVTNSEIANFTILANNLGADCVTTAKILDANVTLAKMAANSVGTTQLINNSVTRAVLAAGAAGMAVSAQAGASGTVSVAVGPQTATLLVGYFRATQAGSPTITLGGTVFPGVTTVVNQVYPFTIVVGSGGTHTFSVSGITSNNITLSAIGIN